MKLGAIIRVMGDASHADTLQSAAVAAEEAGLDEAWVVDHVAIPPDDAEGSNGRYLDPLATLAWLAGKTERIGLGTSVLVLPYRPAFPTAKWIATIQELSGGRLQLGVGVGWMRPEFQALGVPFSERGLRTDRVLETLHRCFDADDDVVEENGQPLLFRPRPTRPPIFVGGRGEHALRRAVRFGEGWMPMGNDPEKLAPEVAKLRELAEAAGRPTPEVVSLGGLPPGQPERGAEILHALAEVGVTRFAAGARYDDADGFRRGLDDLRAAREAAGWEPA
ncbi:MAG: TIGR03619 family F420-dependent LLM class oxidoreductase [Myxococcota bacterium]|nr:TIGR03619 family F420-dependent LLM class oxidoreductase [Myxococcota bacterium]